MQGVFSSDWSSRLSLPCNLTYLMHSALFISQGCCSDISSMVKEARKEVTQIVQGAVKSVGQLAALKGSQLRFLEGSLSKAAGVRVS